MAFPSKFKLSDPEIQFLDIFLKGTLAHVEEGIPINVHNNIVY